MNKKFVLIIEILDKDGPKKYYFAGFDQLRNSSRLMTTNINEAMMIDSKEDIAKLKGGIYEQCIALDKKYDGYYGERRTVQDIDKIVDEYTNLTIKEIVAQGQLMEVLRKTVYPLVPGQAKIFNVYRLTIGDDTCYYKYTTPDGRIFLTRDIEEAKVFRTTDVVPIDKDSYNWEIEDWNYGKEEYEYQRVAYIFNDFGNFENYLFFFDAKFVKVTSMYEVENKERTLKRN